MLLPSTIIISFNEINAKTTPNQQSQINSTPLICLLIGLDCGSGKGSNQPHFFILFISTPMKRIEKKCWVVLLLLLRKSTTNFHQIHFFLNLIERVGLLFASLGRPAGLSFIHFIHQTFSFSSFRSFSPLPQPMSRIDFTNCLHFIQQLSSSIPFHGCCGPRSLHSKEIHSSFL